MVEQIKVTVFLSYSHQDERLRAKLDTHLSSLKRDEVIGTWDDRKLVAGQELDEEIADRLRMADIILLLISPDFVASFYCYDIEMAKALERHKAALTKVIPIILRPTENWQKRPFGKLVALPKDGKPVTKWKTRDDAFVDIASGVRKAAEYSVRHCRDNHVLENTMSNPRYDRDLSALDGKWKLQAVLNEETILIVIGNLVVTELLDRPTAEHLRDEIDQLGNGHPYRRALVISSGAWQQQTKSGGISKVMSAIAVGGSRSFNDLTKQLESSDPYTIAPGVYGAFRKTGAGKPQAALWGDTAAKTRMSVENYIARTDGLQEFLKMCWPK